MVISKKFMLVLCILCPMTASAHDLVQPVWREQDGTTYQRWEFDTNDNPVVLTNAYGQATATITVGEYGSGWNYDLGLGTQIGIWDIGGTDGNIVLDIDNHPEPLRYKDIWLQITYYTFGGLGDVPTITIPEATFLSSETHVIEEDPVFPGSGWFLNQSIWRLEPNPSNEQITLTGASTGSTIDQIVVDTKSVTAECIVDFSELAAFCEQWLWYGSDLKFDLNNSGHVDFKDFSIFANSWLYLCPW